MKSVTVYTQTICPYCTAAKSMLTGKKIAFEEVNLDKRPDAEWEALQKKTGFKTLPQIFIGEDFVGGYQELSALDRSGQLEKKLT